MSWLLIPVGALVLTWLWWSLRKPDLMFEEVTRRQRAMEALGKRYDPKHDTVLKRLNKRGGDGPVPDER